MYERIIGPHDNKLYHKIFKHFQLYARPNPVVKTQSLRTCSNEEVSKK